jgi:hypothetical protein
MLDWTRENLEGRGSEWVRRCLEDRVSSEGNTGGTVPLTDCNTGSRSGLREKDVVIARCWGETQWSGERCNEYRFGSERGGVSQRQRPGFGYLAQIDLGWFSDRMRRRPVWVNCCQLRLECCSSKESEKGRKPLFYSQLKLGFWDSEECRQMP